MAVEIRYTLVRMSDLKGEFKVGDAVPFAGDVDLGGGECPEEAAFGLAAVEGGDLAPHHVFEQVAAGDGLAGGEGGRRGDGERVSGSLTEPRSACRGQFAFG